MGTVATLKSLARRMVPHCLHPAHRIRSRILRRSGYRVTAGPFAGMRYVRAAIGSAYFPKIAGTYEQELRPIIETACALSPDVVVDIGAAEGYYAVGLSLRLPDARTIAYESDPTGRSLMLQMVELNRLPLGQVRIEGTCDAPQLQRCLTEVRRALVVCDAEGAERHLLDPASVPALSTAHILVEVHDFLDQSIGSVLEHRFSTTHRIACIWSVDRSAHDFPRDRLGGSLYPRRYLTDVLWEQRPQRMRWFWMEPSWHDVPPSDTLRGEG